MKAKLLIMCILIPFGMLFSQDWQQLAGEPDGGGVTDIFYDEATDDLFVATGSFNWPNGEDGGIRRSSDDGQTWENLIDAYTSRFIMKGPDGNLYASIWEYPQDEGLYRSTDNGATWNLLISVPSGNNIFACTILEGSPNIIFAGTGAGVYRSLDNGATWAYANTGLPAGELIRSMEISPDGGTIAAGTTSGLYVSSNNGDNWDEVTGDGEDEIITALVFDVIEEDSKSGVYLVFGSEGGRLYMANASTFYLTAALLTTLILYQGITRLTMYRFTGTNYLSVFLASLYSPTGGSFMFAQAGWFGWLALMGGLPSYPAISMFTSYFVVATLTIVMYLAIYGNNNNGTTIYKNTKGLTTGIHASPYNYEAMALFQNMPNPFKDKTLIPFKLAEKGKTTLELFDMAGNLVRTVIKGEIRSAGNHCINLTSEGIPAGMYYYVLRSNNYSQTKKLVIH